MTSPALRIGRTPGAVEVVAAALLLALGCAAAPPAVPLAAPTAAPTAEPGPGPLLWLARPADGQPGALYLLGSVHVSSEEPRLGPAVEAAYLRSDELVVEIDLTAVDARESALLLARLGILPPGEILPQKLSVETWRLLRAYAKANDMPEVYLERFEPWVVASLIAVVELQKAGFRSEGGVDRRFLERAAGRKPIVGLETAESQLRMLDELDPSLQDLMIKDMLVRSDRVGEEATALIASWQQGDEAAVTETLFSPLDEYPELAGFYEAVYFDRNEEMTARLVELARDGRTRFVVLGAGHMVGDRGIPALLARRGFRVERVGGPGAAVAPRP
jgi:uncharacterized protein YbaP (TraB family)